MAFEAEIRARYGSVRAPTDPQVFRPPGAFLVLYAPSAPDATDEERVPVGCAGLEPLEPAGTAEVRKFFVVAAARGRGLSRVLLTALESRARELGHTRLRLDTGDRQPEALGLYRAAGYSPIPDYNGNPLAAHWMEKRLA